MFEILSSRFAQPEKWSFLADTISIPECLSIHHFVYFSQMNFFLPSISANIPRLYIIKVAKWFMLTMPILMLFYLDFGLTNKQAFQLKAVYSIAIVIFEIPSGYIADVLGRRTTLILGAFLGTMGFAFYIIGNGFFWFMIAEITLGIGQSFISGADSALLYDSLKYNQLENKYLRYEGINTSIGNFSEAFGAILGGALAEISLRTPFYWQTGIAFLAIPAALTLVEPPSVSIRQKPGMSDIVRIIKYSLITNRHLRWNLVYSSLIGATTLTMAWVYQLQLHAMGYNEFKIGATATALNLLLGFVTLWSYRVENYMKPKTIIRITTLIITGGFVAAGLSNTPLMFLIILIGFYSARGIATPVLKDYINRLTTSDIRATVLSIRSLIIRAFFAIIAPFFGWMADVLSLSQALIIIGLVMMVIAGSIIHLFVQSVEKKPL